jgi:uncharacterized protein
VLTADMVRAQRRGNRLVLIKLNAKSHQRASELAEAYLAIANENVGGRRDEYDERCATVLTEGWDRKLARGLLKLVEDRCEFVGPETGDPAELRRALFHYAASERRGLNFDQVFDRNPIIKSFAKQRQISPAELEELLFADLRAAQQLASFDSLSAEGLVKQYQEKQAQAVLLRAVNLKAQILCSDARTLRYLFNRLKFLRLLFRLQRDDDNGRYHLTIDGPFSLFRSVTKYGLQLALALPAIQSCDEWQLQADVRWGKTREPLSFELSGKSNAANGKASPTLAPESESLLNRFASRKGPWRAQSCSDILELPGVGLCIPDLCFIHKQTGECVYLEVLGYWSREAAWKRIDLVKGGLPQKIIFALSENLRVSEAALSDTLPSALYVYKSSLRTHAVEEKLNELLARK